MSDSPAERLAAWFDSLPPMAGGALAYRVASLLPPTGGVDPMADPTAAGVSTWLRAASTSFMRDVGAAIMAAALVDFLLAAPSLNRDLSHMLVTAESRERERFLSAQDRRMRELWAELRAGALSPTEVDQWLRERIEEAKRAIFPPSS